MPISRPWNFRWRFLCEKVQLRPFLFFHAAFSLFLYFGSIFVPLTQSVSDKNSTCWCRRTLFLFLCVENIGDLRRHTWAICHPLGKGLSILFCTTLSLYPKLSTFSQIDYSQNDSSKGWALPSSIRKSSIEHWALVPLPLPGGHP